MDPDYYQKAFDLIKKQHEWRKNCLNMIASENVTSPAVREAIISDFGHRYAEGVLGGEDKETGLRVFDRYYQGTRVFDKVESLAMDLAEEIFNAEHANVVPISGVVSNLAAYYALTQRGDTITGLSLADGGHISHCKVSAAGVMGLKDVSYAFNEQEMNIDVDKSIEIIREKEPSIMLFGASVFLFPHPIKELRDVADEVDAKIVYDGAHVAGLIAGKEFQDPFEEGADVFTSSTHKTLPGPQGGMILSTNELSDRLDNAAFPGLMSNHHLHHVAGLLVALEEMRLFGADYAKQTISNAKALAEQLYDQGLDVLCPEKDFTQSHQILIDVSDEGGGKKYAEKCEEANIILNKNLLPWDSMKSATNPSGLRLGVQELTRLGMKEGEMKEVASLLKNLILDGEKPSKTKEKVKDLMQDFKKVHYGFESDKNAYELIRFK